MAQLGGPCNINLLGEMFLPNHSDLQELRKYDVPNSVKSEFLTNNALHEEEDGVLAAQSIGIRMTTRTVYRSLRGVLEAKWPQLIKHLPLPNSCDNAHLFSSMSAGLLKGTNEAGQMDIIVRFSRNQVAKDKMNIWASDNAIVSVNLGTNKASYEYMDGLSKHEIENSIIKISQKYDTNENGVIQSIKTSNDSLLSMSKVISNELPNLGKLLRTTVRPLSKSVVKPVRIRPGLGTQRAVSPEEVIQEWGTPSLKDRLARELKGDFSKGEINEEERQSLSYALALSALSNKLSSHKTGPMKLIEAESKYIPIEHAIVGIAQNTIRGIKNTSPFAREVIEIAKMTFIPDAPYKEHTMAKHEFVIALQSKSVRPGMNFLITPHELPPLFKHTISGWWTVGGNRWKTVQIRKETRRMGFRGYDVGFVVSKESYRNKKRFFEHYIYTSYYDMKLSEWKYVPEPVQKNFKDSLKAGVLYSYENDTVQIVSHKQLVKASTRLTNQGLLYLQIESACIPLYYSRKRMLVDELIVARKTSNILNEAHVRVLGSNGSHRFRDKRMKELMSRTLSLQEADNILAEYDSPGLLSLVNDMTIAIPKTTTEEERRDIEMAASHAINFVKSIDPLYDEEFESDSDSYQGIGDMFDSEYLEHTYFYDDTFFDEDMQEEAKTILENEPEERELDEELFNEGLRMMMEMAYEEDEGF